MTPNESLESFQKVNVASKNWHHNIQQNGTHQNSHQMTFIRMTLTRMSVVKSVAAFQKENMSLKTYRKAFNRMTFTR